MTIKRDDWVNINKQQKEQLKKSDNDWSNREKGCHVFNRTEVVAALDDYATKNGWKWGNHGKNKTPALLLFYPKTQSITLLEP